MKRGLGQIETGFFAYTQMRGLSTVRTGELREPLRLTAIQELKLLNRMAKAGLIARVWRGLYLVPPKLPLGGKWSPNDILALSTLMVEMEGRYQICGPNAFNRYGFDEQIPTRTYAYNDRIFGVRRVGSVTLSLIKVASDRLGDTEIVKTTDGVSGVYCSRARALVDAVYDWSRFNGLPRGYDWIRQELMKKRVTASELTKSTLKFGDKGTIRRIGYLLGTIGTDARLLKTLERAVPPTSALIPWIPTLPKRGTVNRRWGLVVNE